MSRQVPVGFLMSLSQNAEAMERFADLSPEGRDAIIEKARHARSKGEMEAIIRGI